MPDRAAGDSSNFKNELKSCGPFLHNDPLDRPERIFGGVTSLYFGGKRQPYLLLPMIPPARPTAQSKSRAKARTREVIKNAAIISGRHFIKGVAANRISRHSVSNRKVVEPLAGSGNVERKRTLAFTSS